MSDRLLEDERLDELLGLVFESDPPDNGFTHRVMARIETPRLPARVVHGRLAGWRRFITRPIALAAAILLLMGVAYAAIVTTSSNLPGVNREEKKERPRPGDESKGSKANDEATARERAQSSSSPSPAMRSGTAEHGYSSTHTAYVIDQGLRLETETYVNDLKVNRGQRVTLTLQNQTNERIVIYGQKGCLLSVSVTKYQKESSTSDSTDPGSMVCANSDGRAEPYPSKSEGEYTVLEPNSKRVGNATITVQQADEWAIVGLCNCFNRYKSSASPSPSPSPGLSPQLRLGLGVPEPTLGRTPPPQEGYRRMFTPPIKMVAK